MGVYATVGRLGRDAEARFTPSGTAVANFPLAVDVGFGDNKSTLWLDCTLWGKRAEGGVVQYLTKGQQVYVTGEISSREYQKNGGDKGFAVTLRIDDLKLAGQANPQGGQAPQQQRPPQQQPQPQQQSQRPPQNQAPQQSYGAPDFDDFNDEIPFN